MDKLHIKTPSRTYPVFIQVSILPYLFEYISHEYNHQKIVLISNRTIWKLYGKQFEKYLVDFPHIVLFVPDSEKAKSFLTAQHIYTKMLKFSCNRKTILLAFGGGVVGDLSGFIASTFMRGIALIQLPTTLLAQTDSSIGGKQALNHPLGKNLIGTFYQPNAVFIDPTWLKTLDMRQIQNGLAEIIKYGFIHDAYFLQYVKKYIHQLHHIELPKIIYTIKKSIEIKDKIVQKDEKELGIRAILNFGHTVGHALEAYHRFEKVQHGEGVFLGMVVALKLSEFFAKDTLDTQNNISFLQSIYTYPYKKKPPFNELLTLIKKDKKSTTDSINFVLLKSIGKAYIKRNIPPKLVKQKIEESL